MAFYMAFYIIEPQFFPIHLGVSIFVGVHLE